MACPSFDVTLVRSIDFNGSSSPILYEIASAFETFNGCFGKIGNNLLEQPLFLNLNVVRSSADSGLIDVAFYGKTFYSLHRDAIRKLTINDCLSDGMFKTIREFQSMNLPLSIAAWVGLRSAVLLARKKIIQCDTQPVTLDRFLKGIKKGSKKFREVIDRSAYQSRFVLDITVVNGFSRITKTPIPTEIIIKNLIQGGTVLS